MQTERRVKRFELPYHLVANMLLPKDIYTRVTDVDLPEDAKIIHVEPDHQRSMFIFYVRSETFEEVPHGGMTPIIYPVFHIRSLDSMNNPFSKLHTHPKLEEALGLTKDDHVIVDRKDWEEVLFFIEDKPTPEQPRDQRRCYNCGQTSSDTCVDCAQEGTLTHWIQEEKK